LNTVSIGTLDEHILFWANRVATVYGLSKDELAECIVKAKALVLKAKSYSPYSPANQLYPNSTCYSGYTTESMAQAKVYLAVTTLMCKPMTFIDYCENLKARRKAVWRIVRKLREENEGHDARLSCYLKPHLFIKKIVDLWGLGARARGKAYRLADEWLKKKKVNVNPRADAIAILILLNEQNPQPYFPTQISLASELHVTGVTIRNHYDLIGKTLNLPRKLHWRDKQ